MAVTPGACALKMEAQCELTPLAGEPPIGVQNIKNKYDFKNYE